MNKKLENVDEDSLAAVDLRAEIMVLRRAEEVLEKHKDVFLHIFQEPLTVKMGVQQDKEIKSIM